jgi:hypothetical protein
MSNYQVGYGHGDVVGVPFDFYAGATLVTGSTITMQTGVLIVAPPATIAALTVNLPLNPVDGAIAEISVTGAGVNVTGLTVNANTGDSLLGAAFVGPLTALATTLAAAISTIRYRYTLNGFQPASGAAVNPRTWCRVQ